MLALIYATTASGAFYAFTDWTGIGDYNFVGLDNFRRIFQTEELTGSLINTLLLAFGFLVFTNIFGLLFALALNRTLKSRFVLRTLLFMPVVIAPIAVSYMWKFIFAFNGPLNQTLEALGLDSWKHDWLADPTLALIAVLVVMVWQNIGFVMVIYLAGLATVPIELEEAASLDGAGIWRRFRTIVLPMIQPSVAIATTLMLDPGPARLRPGARAHRWRTVGRHPDAGDRDLPADVHLQQFRLRRRARPHAQRADPRLHRHPAVRHPRTRLTGHRTRTRTGRRRVPLHQEDAAPRDRRDHRRGRSC